MVDRCFSVFLFFCFYLCSDTYLLRHGFIMLCVPLLTDPNQRTQLFIDWGSASVLPLRRALALGRQQSPDRVGST